MNGEKLTRDKLINTCLSLCTYANANRIVHLYEKVIKVCWANRPWLDGWCLITKMSKMPREWGTSRLTFNGSGTLHELNPKFPPNTSLIWAPLWYASVFLHLFHWNSNPISEKCGRQGPIRTEMQSNSLPFPLIPLALFNGAELSEGGFELSRYLFLGSLLFSSPGGTAAGMDLSKVGEKIFSSVRSARSLGLLPASPSDRPEVISFIYSPTFQLLITLLLFTGLAKNQQTVLFWFWLWFLSRIRDL